MFGNLAHTSRDLNGRQVPAGWNACFPYRGPKGNQFRLSFRSTDFTTKFSSPDALCRGLEALSTPLSVQAFVWPARARTEESLCKAAKLTAFPMCSHDAVNGMGI